ncbi:cold shock domain-containing protein [Vibrio hepatarius]|uniref:cold shock domain-containing protein n=1 Tax=Vibrio hepatarius TaxID=171383 RepID=UPI001C090854|nr:cold shock domain-containing protein [Vibrio hepatarius]MBU2898288.1 cold shock domain-containing protein [Vibrio hepatarius]
MAKFSGTIKCFFPEKGFGFITDSNSGKDLYFNAAALREELHHTPPNELVGKPVAFRAGSNAKGLKAVEVLLNKKALQAIEAELQAKAEIKAEAKIKPNAQKAAAAGAAAAKKAKAKKQTAQKQSHTQAAQSAEPVSSNNLKDKVKADTNKEGTKELSRLAMCKNKGDAVTMKFLKVTKLDDPKTIELVKVKVTKFALMQQYKFKIGLSKAALAFVRVADRSLNRIEKLGQGLSKTKQPNLKSI